MGSEFLPCTRESLTGDKTAVADEITRNQDVTASFHFHNELVQMERVNYSYRAAWTQQVHF